jgi:hypothetical protein
MITRSNAPRPSSVELVEVQIQVLISAPVNTFDLVNAIMFSCRSRAREQACVSTDSEGALFQAVENNLGVRLSASELRWIFKLVLPWNRNGKTVNRERIDTQCMKVN